jgi:tetratricopeptide (TPR) repeat protein
MMLSKVLSLYRNTKRVAFYKAKQVGCICLLSSYPNIYTAVNRVHWNVPFGRNWKFVGQASHLNRLENALFTESQPPKIAITGLGGVGKTQIVLELAYRTKEKHQDCSVFWLPATNAESLQQAFTDIGQQLEVPGIEEKQADVKKLVQRHLSQESAGEWLLIVDNVDDIEIWNHELKAYLPKSQQGYVVCTTRNRKVAVKIARSNVIEVAEMDEEMAMQLLTKSLINQELLNSHQDAQKLLEQLTFLPLAIVQAAAYINENGIALSEYLVLLEEQEQDVIDLLSEDFDDDGRYEDVKNPVATTWLVSFEHIRRLDPLAAEYLSFMSCIDPKDIPQSLLPPAQSRKKETDAIGTLDAYSFVSKRAADEALDVHRLVHLAMRNWLRTNNEWLVWADKTLERLVEVIRPDGHSNKKVRKACLPHAHYIVGCTAEEKQIGKRTYLLDHMAVFLKVEGRYNEASNAFSLLVKTLQQVLGEEHPTTLDTMVNLAGTYRDQGRWEDAETLFLQVLEVKIRVLGDKDHFSILATRNNLALTYYVQKRWKEAEELQVQVMETCLRVFSAEDSHTLTSQANLAATYSKQGRLKEAEELEVQVLETRLRVLRDEHPSTLTSKANLATTYSRQGRWKEAEDLQVQELETSLRVFGEEHPSTLISKANLAFILKAQNRNTEAISLMEECYQLRKRILGDDHPDTETSLGEVIRWTMEDMGLTMEDMELQN